MLWFTLFTILGLLFTPLDETIRTHQYDAIPLAGWIGALLQSPQGLLLGGTVFFAGLLIWIWWQEHSF